MIFLLGLDLDLDLVEPDDLEEVSRRLPHGGKGGFYNEKFWSSTDNGPLRTRALLCNFASIETPNLKDPLLLLGEFSTELIGAVESYSEVVISTVGPGLP